ncbi:MAG: hypothetical protein V7L04_12055 [Nostoc sp.]
MNIPSILWVRQCQKAAHNLTYQRQLYDNELHNLLLDQLYSQE